MSRAELLKQELQIQQARIAQENRLQAERLESAYAAVGELNFLGFSPKQLHKQISGSFLRGAYSHCRLPAVELPTIHNAHTSTPPPSNPLPLANGSPMGTSNPVSLDASIPTKRSTILRREQRKRKRIEKESNKSGPMWDSEWVAPQTPAAPKRTKFGDNTWSSKLIVNLEDSDSESEADEPLATVEDVEKAECETREYIAQLQAEAKGQQNHIKQREEQLEKQRKVILENQQLLKATLDKYKEAVEELSELTTTSPQKPRNPNTVDDGVAEEQGEAELEGNDDDFKVTNASICDVSDAQPILLSPEDNVASSTTANAPTDAYRLNSPLASFNSYRISRLFVGGIPSRAYSRTYNSSFVKDGEMCVTELDGGVCQDEQCEFIHFSDYDVPQQQVLTHILKKYIDTNTKKQFARELRTLDDSNSEEMIVLLLNLLTTNQQEAEKS